ncbi:AlpA family transcriptional regulator [Shewanella canadensis]|uniref:AlpA family transcriptional regulator n=1 Tax=Shewanella canadensis TaxID=271096 RepID=A0A3S0KV85_9GAMM|nr:AlpA family transcriptional regulator [Shewanella canadensis]RTR38441.1 AlpA family transcriptional regulator [Shewanella canadensis]
MKIIRLKKVIFKTDLSRSTIYELIAQDQFPKQLSLGPRCVGWIEQEIDDWLSEKAAARD